MQGTKQTPLPMVKKLDPPVLWVLCMVRCRHMVLGAIFQDTNLWQRTHRDWCCDTCFHAGRFHSRPAERDPTLHELSPSTSIENPEPRQLAKRPIKKSADSLPHKNPKPSPRVEKLLQDRLTQVRYNIWSHLAIPGTVPCIVFTDQILAKIVAGAHKIGKPDDLGRLLLMAGVDIQLSLLEDDHINAMCMVIQYTLAHTPPRMISLPIENCPAIPKSSTSEPASPGFTSCLCELLWSCPLSWISFKASDVHRGWII
jgi:hypothetical protein